MFKKIESKANEIILSLILLLPFLDIYRSLIGNRIELFGISFVEILHFIFTGFLFLLLWIKEKKKNSSKLLLILLLYVIYIMLHIFYIIQLKDISIINYSINNKLILVEGYYIIKSYLLPFIIFFVFIKSEIKTIDILDTLSKLAFIFGIVVVVTNLLGVSLIAYNSTSKVATIKGSIITWFFGIDENKANLYTSKGLFYSTNQLSSIMGTLLFVSAFYTAYKDKIKYYFSFFIKSLAALMVSTKTAFFAIIFSILSIFIYALMKLIINKEKILKTKNICFLIILLIIMFFYNFSPIKILLNDYVDNYVNEEKNDWNEDSHDDSCKVDNIVEIEERYDFKSNKVDVSDLSIDDEKYLEKYLKECPNIFNIPNEYVSFYDPEKNFDFWFEVINDKTSVVTNHRKLKNMMYNDFLSKNNKRGDKFFGIGYISNFPYMEKDIVAQNVYFGYFGIALFIVPYLTFILLSIIKMLVLYKKKFTFENVSLVLASVFMVFASVFAGHVFGNFVPNAILAIIIATLYKNVFEVEKNNNKISFLLLHLGYGGIETATINTANSLVDKYDIELVSFYKLDKNQVSKIDDRIKIKYLYNGSPNREEFKNSIKEHKYFKTLKEGIKAINILTKKKLLIIRNITNNDSKYVVSTRCEFSILLSKYGDSNTVKIAQEHHYHNNNKKYINILKKKYYNIDYLFALTKTLEEDYKKFLKNNKHTKVVLVPNMLENIPSINSDLKDKNIITISRLDLGKKNDDIIKAFSKLKEKDWKLYIIGDGKEYNNLSNLIDELKLNDRVILTGYKNKEEIEEYMLKSSLFLMASLSEGLPMVLLEAMSYGIPCIAYETASGVSDIINNTKNGYVIKNRDEKEYIEKIEKVIDDTKLRDKLGKEAKKTVYIFSKESILRIWKSVLK